MITVFNFVQAWLGEGLSMLLPHLSISRYPPPDGALPVLVKFVSPSSRRVSPGSFHSVRSPGDDTRYSSVISNSTYVPCPGPLPPSDLFVHICDECLLSCLCVSVPIGDV